LGLAESIGFLHGFARDCLGFHTANVHVVDDDVDDDAGGGMATDAMQLLKSVYHKHEGSINIWPKEKTMAMETE
jgi:hypothetical protein